MRILVTNDDGIDSVGLHVLARAMKQHGEVVIGAPDSEYSGASASFGSLNVVRPELHVAHVDGIDEAWAISGPPAMCVMFARLGALGDPFDLVVSGINPGANVGRAVYHSGTVGAATTARSGGITGVAVSQAVDMGGPLGQAWEEQVANLRWDTAADVAAAAVGAIIADPLPEPAVLNINVPNREVADIAGCRFTEIGARPTVGMASVELVPKVGHEGAYHLEMSWSQAENNQPITTDVGAVAEGYVALSWLSTFHAIDVEGGKVAAAGIETLLG